MQYMYLIQSTSFSDFFKFVLIIVLPKEYVLAQWAIIYPSLLWRVANFSFYCYRALSQGKFTQYYHQQGGLIDKGKCQETISTDQKT